MSLKRIISLDIIPDQLMQIKFIENIILDFFITPNALYIEVYHTETSDLQKYIMHLSCEQKNTITLQEVFDCVFKEVPPFNAYDKSQLKFTITATTEKTLAAASEAAGARVRAGARAAGAGSGAAAFARTQPVTIKTILAMPIEQLSVSIGEFTYRTIKECGTCKKKLPGFKKKCGGCEEVYYCGIECQSEQWDYHKHFCYKDVFGE